MKRAFLLGVLLLLQGCLLSPESPGPMGDAVGVLGKNPPTDPDPIPPTYKTRGSIYANVQPTYSCKLKSGETLFGVKEYVEVLEGKAYSLGDACSLQEEVVPLTLPNTFELSVDSSARLLGYSGNVYQKVASADEELDMTFVPDEVEAWCRYYRETMKATVALEFVVNKVDKKRTALIFGRSTLDEDQEFTSGPHSVVRNTSNQIIDYGIPPLENDPGGKAPRMVRYLETLFIQIFKSGLATMPGTYKATMHLSPLFVPEVEWATYVVRTTEKIPMYCYVPELQSQTPMVYKSVDEWIVNKSDYKDLELPKKK